MSQHTVRVTARRMLTPRIVEIELECTDGALPRWQPGAHIRVLLPEGGDRAYSLIRHPGEDGARYRIAVQLEEPSAGGSAFMHTLKEGDTLTIKAPKCDFPLAAGSPAILLAGGIGITPMLSMAAALTEHGTGFALHYAGRDPEMMAYADRLAALYGDTYTQHIDGTASALDLPALVEEAGDGVNLYVCGPRGLIEAVRESAAEQGISPNFIHFELFTNGQADADNTPFDLIVEGETYHVPADKTIVDVLEEHGVAVTHDCQRGDCGICQARVLSGIPDHRDVVLTDAERAANTKMQICVSRAKTPTLEIALGQTARKARPKRARIAASGASRIHDLVRPEEVHRDCYISPEIYKLEMKHLFANAWIFVGHDSQTPDHGDYITTQVGDQPVIMVRHSDDQVHVLYNRCPHKGTKIAIDRQGNTGKFFRCPYHAWSFKTDGCLLAIPLAKGYDATGFDDNPNVQGMQPVGAVKNYRGFIFVRLAEEGISFEDFFGDSLSSLDNMVDRSPEGRLEIAGAPLRYMHHCNYKMLVENQTDTCHPMVAHESSAGTAVRLWNDLDMPEGTPLPPAMEIIAPFTSPYEFFENMGIRTWPNGHGHTGVHHSIHSEYSAIPGYWDAMVETYGEEKAKAILADNRHNTVYFPNIMIKGPIQQLRNFIPLGPDKTLVESYIYRLVGAPEELTARTAMYNRMINAPTSIVGHDDLEMYERAQEGLHADGMEWVNIQRLYEEGEDFGEIAVENGTTERQMRNQFDAWVKFMTWDMPEDTEQAQEAAE